MLRFPIFDKLGGEPAALALLESEGHPVGTHAIHKWKRLRRVSTPAKVVFMKECIRRGIPHSDADYEAIDRDRDAAE